jgi:hypothetical protein
MRLSNVMDHSHKIVCDWQNRKLGILNVQGHVGHQTLLVFLTSDMSVDILKNQK